ncbi:TPA: ribosome recycling factor [Candidatus Saccharibacteria bacterium]|nr:ribosome recycling factor [Candidatus Saccharibacteria bacterium]
MSVQFAILVREKRGYMFDTTPYEQKMNSALTHFEDDLKKVRTGRAHPAMLESVQVEMYGTKMPLNQAANITAPESQQLLVTPFDPSNIVAVVTAIRDDQSLGFNPSDDGRVVRVPVPALTEERRKQLVKQTSEKVEEARIALRNIRQDALKDAKAKKQAKELSEDDEKRVGKEIDKLMSDMQLKIDEAFKSKEKDILTI